MGFYFAQLLTGLANASSLFLIASGLSIIFGVTRIVNFAHGSFYMVGAYLAYTLGELHYLAFACDGLESQDWRNRMLELLAMETPARGGDRDRLIEAFNDGYRVQQRYRPVCGPEVEAERRALAHRGRDLAEMMRATYFD